MMFSPEEMRELTLLMAGKEALSAHELAPPKRQQDMPRKQRRQITAAARKTMRKRFR